MVANIDTKIRWTSADLEFFPDNGDRYEIIDGDLYVTRAPHWKHQDAITNLCKALANWTSAHQKGKVLSTPGLIFAGEDNVIPDLVWISDEKLATSVDESGHFTAAPELIIEVLSQTARDISRDRQVKLKLYSRVGVKEYWIVDWQRKTVEIYRRSQTRLELICTLFVEDELSSPLFPEFSLKVAEIFV
ncbi:MAG: Uma2 family endonuclease [Limnothrix sp. RL_2_0]|nr:Uma2 family endonuclease [Limnothrix sp. RL_2_0]